MVGDLLGKAVDMEAAHAGDIGAQVVLPARAEPAGAAGQCRERHDVVARHKCLDTVADRDDLARRLGPDGQRQ